MEKECTHLKTSLGCDYLRSPRSSCLVVQVSMTKSYKFKQRLCFCSLLKRLLDFLPGDWRLLGSLCKPTASANTADF